MNTVEVSSEVKNSIEILPVNENDYKSITKKRYFFDWKKDQDFEVYKLCILNSNDILGLISLEKIPEEWRIQIRLLTVSAENKGKNKIYDKIAGNLIAHASKIAVEDYGNLACVSLTPKTEIVKHYIEKYNLSLTGRTLSIEVPEILHLINKYDYE